MDPAAGVDQPVPGDGPPPDWSSPATARPMGVPEDHVIGADAEPGHHPPSAPSPARRSAFRQAGAQRAQPRPVEGGHQPPARPGDRRERADGSPGPVSACQPRVEPVAAAAGGAGSKAGPRRPGSRRRSAPAWPRSPSVVRGPGRRRRSGASRRRPAALQRGTVRVQVEIVAVRRVDVVAQPHARVVGPNRAGASAARHLGQRLLGPPVDLGLSVIGCGVSPRSRRTLQPESR